MVYHVNNDFSRKQYTQKGGKNMASLRGTYDASVDDKGRMSLPAKHRKLLPEELVIAMSPKKEIPALVVYTEEGFDDWFEKLLVSKGGERANDELQADLEDEIYRESANITVDSIGRISIPPRLREYAGIGRDAVVTGSRNHLIIRTPEALEKSREASASNRVFDKPASLPTE